MQTIQETRYLRAAINKEKQAGKNIALVPTMGNLHDGHLKLVRRAHELADIVVVSIFVNPMQFAAHEDLDTYPRTPGEDRRALEQLGVQYLFTPDVATMYPSGIEDHTRVSIDKLGSQLCGKSRPVFFEGVCTVVCKLFSLVQPDLAIFGEKDLQQLTIIRRMTSDLCLPIEIIGVATAREANGLAMSSRNNYLSEAEKATASRVFQTLCEAREKVLSGRKDYSRICEHALSQLESDGFQPDYFEIRNASNLDKIEDGEKTGSLAILAAAILGKTRLIDNIIFDTTGAA